MRTPPKKNPSIGFGPLTQYKIQELNPTRIQTLKWGQEVPSGDRSPPPRSFHATPECDNLSTRRASLTINEDRSVSPMESKNLVHWKKAVMKVTEAKKYGLNFKAKAAAVQAYR